MSDEGRITTVQFVPYDINRYGTTFHQTEIIAYWQDGSFSLLFSYYEDEIKFRADELIGLTRAEAIALRHQKDKEYLQS